MISLIYKITVNLIHDHDDTMLFTDFGSLTQFFFCPDTGHRVMRAAKQKQFYLFFCDLALHIFIIHVIFSVFHNQWIIHQFSSVFFYHIGKWMINRALDHNAVPLFCVSTDCCCQRKYHTRSDDHPVFFHLPSKPLRKPVFQCMIIAVTQHGITVYTTICHFF